MQLMQFITPPPTAMETAAAAVVANFRVRDATSAATYPAQFLKRNFSSPGAPPALNP